MVNAYNNSEDLLDCISNTDFSGDVKTAPYHFLVYQHHNVVDFLQAMAKISAG